MRFQISVKTRSLEATPHEGIAHDTRERELQTSFLLTKDVAYYPARIHSSPIVQETEKEKTKEQKRKEHIIDGGPLEGNEKATITNTQKAREKSTSLNSSCFQ